MGTRWDGEFQGMWLKAFHETLKQSLFSPKAFFESVGQGTSLLRPWSYATIIAITVFLCIAAYMAGLTFSHFIPLFFLHENISVFLCVLIALVWMPIAVTLGLFIQSSVIHLGLIIMGAARGGFTKTFRVVAYSNGPQLLQIVPILGSVIASLWVMTLNIIGLKVVHETSYIRVMFAVSLPLLLCLAFIVLVMTTAAGAIFAALIAK